MSVEPRYTKKSILKAGDRLAAGALDDEGRADALRRVSYWREAHAEPLVQAMDMVEQAYDVEGALVAGRLKRLETIIDKLNRPGHDFHVTNLQDIAGCRLIVPDEAAARQAIARITAMRKPRRVRDYVTRPKLDGYRGTHLVFRFDAPSYGYGDLSVELQVRTYDQHDWATAVELYSAISGSELKFGRGSDEELEYFRLASDLRHGLGTPEDKARFRYLDERLGIYRQLKAAASSVYEGPASEQRDIVRDDICLVVVNEDLQTIWMDVYPRGAAAHAAEEYTKMESSANTDDKSVYLLARASSDADLLRAFQNYTANISGFVEWLESALVS